MAGRAWGATAIHTASSRPIHSFVAVHSTAMAVMNAPLDLPLQTNKFEVIGHSGMRTTLDGTILIKPAYPAEVQFYQSLQKDPHLAPLRPFTPKFFGTLPLQNFPLKNEATSWNDPSIPRGRTQSVVSENLCSAFDRPNTLDVKLGTVFHDDMTDPDKVLRMEKTSRETTSFKTGVRLTDFLVRVTTLVCMIFAPYSRDELFQLYDNATAEPVSIPKSYGKALKESQLAHGFAQFFPLHNESPHSTLGLPRHLLTPTLRGIREIIARIREAYTPLEMRLVGGSLLIMYEADWNRAEASLIGPAKEQTTPPPLPYTVKLVDFAHARVCTGLGPDEGVLMGLDTMLRLLDGRIAEVGEV